MEKTLILKRALDLNFMEGDKWVVPEQVYSCATRHEKERKQLSRI
jgi:hypothetical protein